jgi:hypothetical protein
MDHAKQRIQGSLSPRRPSTSRAKSPIEANNCEYCNKFFDSEVERQDHEPTHLVEPHYKCWLCDRCRRCFYTSVALEQHIHDRHKNTQCRFCRRRAVAKNGEESTTQHCGDCSKTFQGIIAFLEHDEAVHLSCEFCEQIGKKKERDAFDRHCCGCYANLHTEDEFEQHIQQFPDHFHGHPQFRPKGLDNLMLPRLQTAVPAVQASISPVSPAAGVQIAYTPATPTEAESDPAHAFTQASQQMPPPPLPPRGRVQVSPHVCSECRIAFPDPPTLARHKNFVFSITKNCKTMFTCPFSLLRHIEAGGCCEWRRIEESRSPTTASPQRGTRGRGRPRGSRRGKRGGGTARGGDVVMEDA